MGRSVPPGLIGGIGGALGALPLLSAARTLASRLFSPAELPGAERLAGDLKAATFVEAGVLLALVPLSALFFGALLPQWLEVRARVAGPSFEWAGTAFALAFPLWRRGATAPISLVAAALVAFLTAALLLFCRRCPTRLARLRASREERVAPLVAAAGAWELARRASGGETTAADAALFLAAVLFAVPFLFSPAASARSRARP